MTYTVTIDLEGKKEFKSAMSATATITAREEKDVLTVPVDAIQTKDEQKVVTVLSGDDLSVSEDRVVTLGLVNNTTAQITEGLE
jgi:multidrug efflux pump subunit AcrA (membrane-fusion protein)